MMYDYDFKCATHNRYKNLFHIQADEEIDNNIRQLPPSPAIVVANSDRVSQFFLVVEKEILIECENMEAATEDLMTTYFVFNIGFPVIIHLMFSIRYSGTCYNRLSE